MKTRQGRKEKAAGTRMGVYEAALQSSSDSEGIENADHRPMHTRHKYLWVSQLCMKTPVEGAMYGTGNALQYKLILL